MLLKAVIEEGQPTCSRPRSSARIMTANQSTEIMSGTIPGFNISFSWLNANLAPGVPPCFVRGMFTGSKCKGWRPGWFYRCVAWALPLFSPASFFSLFLLRAACNGCLPGGCVWCVGWCERQKTKKTKKTKPKTQKKNSGWGLDH